MHFPCAHHTLAGVYRTRQLHVLYKSTTVPGPVLSSLLQIKMQHLVATHSCKHLLRAQPSHSRWHPPETPTSPASRKSPLTVLRSCCSLLLRGSHCRVLFGAAQLLRPVLALLDLLARLVRRRLHQPILQTGSRATLASLEVCNNFCSHHWICTLQCQGAALSIVRGWSSPWRKSMHACRLPDKGFHICSPE